MPPKTLLFFLLPWLLVPLGCSLPEIDEDTLDELITGREKRDVACEYFVGLPEGTNTSAGPALREQLVNKLAACPAGTWWTFFDSNTHELIASYQTPDGSPAMREDQAEKQLKAVWSRLDPEMAGGTQDVDLIATPATVRKFRKSETPPRVIIVGSPMVIDREGSGAITESELPCDGTIVADDGCYTRMIDFPAESKLNFFTPIGSYGPGPNFRDQVENHLRLLTNAKKAELVRVSSDAKLLFDFDRSQWDSPAAPRDECNGRKQPLPDEEERKVFNSKGQEIVQLGEDVEVVNQTPEVEWLKGPLSPVLFSIDTSGSVGFDGQGNPRPGPINAIKQDVIEKLKTMRFERFAIQTFGGDNHYRPVYQRFPRRLLGGSYWIEATPQNRKRAIAFVEGLKVGGGTPTAGSLVEAMRLEGPFSCVMYSDGIPTLGEGGMEGCLDLVDRLKEHGVVINAIGVGSLSVTSKVYDATGARFMAEIGVRTGGDYFALPVDAQTGKGVQL